MQLEPYLEGNELGLNPNWAGYKIPYFTPEGKPSNFFRFKYLQRQPSKGFASVVEAPEKSIKYGQQKDTGCHIYLPPLLGTTKWRAVMDNASIPVCMTEGEKKAASACAHGVMPTLGLGGVFSWRSARLRQSFLPILEEFNWDKRLVYICFDSDLVNNPMVRIASSQLSRALLERGALVYPVHLLNRDNGEKQGLDDVIAKDGPGAAEAILHGTKPDPASSQVHELNDEVALIAETAEVVRLADGQVLTAQKFTDVVYKNRKYMEFAVNTKGEQLPPRTKYTAREWMEWPMRLTLNRFVYEPGGGLITDDHNYNTWRGWGVQPSDKGTIRPWEDLFTALLGTATSEQIMWLKRWFAYPLRHPGAKLYSAVLLWGEQGTGKTLLGETMSRIYGQNYRGITNADLVSAYNDWVAGHQFIVGNEISTGNKRSMTDNLKDIITREQAVVNLKYRAQYVIKDCNNYYFTSNHPDAFFIEDNDRRYFVHDVATPPREAQFYARYTRWLDHEGGAARLFHYLLHELDMGDFDPKVRAPMTEAKVQMIMDGKSDLDDWCLRLRADMDSILVSRSTGGSVVLPHSLWTSRDLLQLYDPEGKTRVTQNGMARALKTAGFRYAARGNNTGLVDGARTRFWALRNTAKMDRVGPAALARIYREEREKYATPGKKFEGGRRVN